MIPNTDPTSPEPPKADRLETFARVSGIGSFVASFLPWTLVPVAYLARRWGGPPLIDATAATVGMIGIAGYLLALGSGVMLVRRGPCGTDGGRWGRSAGRSRPS